MGTPKTAAASRRLGRGGGIFGGARRDRTADLLHAMQALSQLSYGPANQAGDDTGTLPSRQVREQPEIRPRQAVTKFR